MSRALRTKPVVTQFTLYVKRVAYEDRAHRTRNAGEGREGGGGREKYRHQTGGIHVSRQSARSDIIIYTKLLQA